MLDILYAELGQNGFERMDGKSFWDAEVYPETLLLKREEDGTILQVERIPRTRKYMPTLIKTNGRTYDEDSLNCLLGEHEPRDLGELIDFAKEETEIQHARMYRKPCRRTPVF